MEAAHGFFEGRRPLNLRRLPGGGPQKVGIAVADITTGVQSGIDGIDSGLSGMNDGLTEMDDGLAEMDANDAHAELAKWRDQSNATD